eukprot:1429220-Rhodomonas_salina.3
MHPGSSIPHVSTGHRMLEQWCCTPISTSLLHRCAEEVHGIAYCMHRMIGGTVPHSTVVGPTARDPPSLLTRALIAAQALSVPGIARRRVA